MALAGEIAKYIGGELKNTGKELATNAATSVLSDLAPKIATKAVAKSTEKSILNGLVPTATRKLASGIELGTDMIPMFRGQTNTLDKLDYNKGLSPNSNGFFMTPNKSATDSWAGKGVVSVDADPNDIMTLDELMSLKKSAEKYFRDPKYQMELYNNNPTQAEIYDALAAGDSYQELSRLTKKPFIERDGGQGTELGEVVFFPDTKPELTSRYNADLASGKNQWLAPTEDVVASETAVPAGTKIKFDKDLNIKDIEKPSRGRGWYADNETNPHISQVVKQNGLDKYLGEPKINYSLAEEPDMVTIYHNTKAENIPSIMEQGLIPGKRPEGYLVSPEEAGIWTDDRGLKSGSYGGTTVKIRVPKKEFDATRVNDTQNLLNRVIKPSEIEGVDYMLFDTPLIKNSNLQEYIDKYGEDKVRNLIEKKGLVSPEVIEEAFSGLGGSAPKVQQSLVDEPKIIYHGTPNKFEDFDESLPSVWFSDSDKNLKDTGLSIKGGQSMNIMKRQLPKDLKIADEDLADRLTKQQLQDRGYAGIAYTERGPNGDETYYEIFKPNETLKKLEAKLPDVRMSYGYGGGYGSYDDNVKRIGSSEVAPVREETLPDGWKELDKYLDTSNDRLSLAIGKPRSKITKQDLINFLEDYGYDTEGTKDDLWKNALMCIDDMALDDLYNAGGSAGQFLQDRLPFRHNDRLTDATNYYIGNKGRTGRLDAEYSDRLGIGRSNTPMSDRLVNPYSGAGGDYSTGAFGTDPTWATGENGVSTTAHERLHAWQDINKYDWDEEVVDAIDELRGELKKYYHDVDTIKKYWGNSKTDYYAEDVEQEARMLQSYLDNEGYTNTTRKNSERGTEWGDEIKPAFDRFFKKLRALSKKGIALPAIAGLVGVGALAGKKDDKSVDNIK